MSALNSDNYDFSEGERSTLQIDRIQDDVLRRLNELNERIELTLEFAMEAARGASLGADESVQSCSE